MRLSCSLTENEGGFWASCYADDVAMATAWDALYWRPFSYPAICTADLTKSQLAILVAAPN